MPAAVTPSCPKSVYGILGHTGPAASPWPGGSKLGKYLNISFRGISYDALSHSPPEPGTWIPAKANKPQPLPKDGLSRRRAAARKLRRATSVDPRTYTGHRAKAVGAPAWLTRGTNQGRPGCGPRGPSAPTNARQAVKSSGIQQHLRVSQPRAPLGANQRLHLAAGPRESIQNEEMKTFTSRKT